MKILALGSLSIPYIGTNWFDAMARELGSACVILNTNLFLASAPSLRPRDALAQHVLDAVREHRPDYLFVYQDWCFEDLEDALFEKIRAAGVRTVCWYPDDEPDFWYDRNRKYDHHFDLVASHASGGVARRRADGFPGRTLYLPWGYNHRRFRADFSVPREFDIVFVGKNKVFDHETMRATEDGAPRQSALDRLARLAGERGYRFRLFGAGWEQHPTLHPFTGGYLDDDAMLRVFQASRLVFNPGWNGDGDATRPQTKLRHFEVPGSGALQVCNWNPELAELFQDGEETLFYRDEDELERVVVGALADPAGLDRKCRAAASRALRDHTLEQRVRTLADHLARDLGGAPSTPVPPAPLLHRRLCPDRASLEALLAELRARPLPAGAHVHILPGELAEVRCADGGLATFTAAHPGAVLRVRTAVEVLGQTSNPMQFHFSQQVICILPETFAWRGAFRIPVDLVQRRLPLLEGAGQLHWLGNWILPAALAVPALEAWLAGDTRALEALAPRNTGYLLNHVFVQPVAGWTADALRMREVTELLRKAADRGWGVVFYGVHGVLPTQVFRVAAGIPGLRVEGVVDRALTSDRFGDFRVIPRDRLLERPPDIILINAVVSGPEVLASLEHLEPRTRLVPVFDLEDPRWDVLLP